MTGIDCPLESTRLGANPTEPDYFGDDIVLIDTDYAHTNAQIYATKLFGGMAIKYAMRKSPVAWVSAQFVNFIFQYTEDFKVKADAFGASIGFRKGCVGVMVRRVETESSSAKNHDLAEYMDKVGSYFEKNPGQAKCVYLITNQVDVMDEAKQQYLKF